MKITNIGFGVRGKIKNNADWPIKGTKPIDIPPQKFL